PLVYRMYYPDLKRDFFYGHETGSKEYADVVQKLNAMTGRPIATAQVAYSGAAFVIDGKKGRELATTGTPAAAPAKEQKEEDPLADVADIPSKELKAGGDADKRYFLIGPNKDAKGPTDGYGLVVILPGGDGSAEFNPFVRRIYKNALPDGYLAAQPV